MKRNILFFIFILFICSSGSVFAQFGKNKVQYKDFDWYYIQTKHFNIFFSSEGSTLAEFTAHAAEDALSSLEKSFNYKINNRITIIVYNSTNDFQETNVTDEYLSEGIEGFTEIFKNRVVIQFMGSYKELRHLIHHELSHAVLNDMFYGGSLQNIIANRISIVLPLWFNEGMAEYQSLGWDVNTDMYIRDAAVSELLPDIPNLNGYFAYRGGQSVFNYIANKYGKQKIGELVNKVKGTGSVEAGIKAALGLDLKELSKKWKKNIKKIYWPDIAIREEPDDFAKRLTDPEKDEGFFNTSPALSPQGDKIAFISNRDTYFDVFIMNAIDGTIIKKLVNGNTTEDFEQLNIITPGLTWSPDGSKIALSAKSGGYDVIYIIDVETEDRETLPFQMDAIKSVTWSPDGKYLAFVGHDAKESDIYIYNFNEQKIVNITNDIFSDNFPAWAPDNSTIYFTSDRTKHINPDSLPKKFKIYNYNYNQDDIYSININTGKIERITNTPNANESSITVSEDGKQILFISDANGINNIYKKKVVLESNDTIKSITDTKAIPVTNSLDGLYQLSSSKDGQKLVFSTLHHASFSIFLMNNPFGVKLDSDSLKPTEYIVKLNSLKEDNKEDDLGHLIQDTTYVKIDEESPVNILTGKVVDSTNVYGDSVQIDFGNYVFLPTEVDSEKIIDKNLAEKNKLKFQNNLDENGNYLVNKYKVAFSPDIVYANAGYSTLYGLLGTTVISFSDVLGNHRLIGITSLQIDLKNSDYGLSYFFLPKRINFGVEGFHTARFVFLRRGFGSNLFRFRNFGLVTSMSYPLSRFYRLDAGLSYLNVSMENLDNPFEPEKRANYIIPSVSFVHDNVLWGYTAPVDGTRYRFDIMGNPGITESNLTFYSFLADYRKYFRLGDEYSFAFRFSGGFSGGANPQRFFMGGTENWINRTFATGDVPLDSPSDFAFLTSALPLRGYNYAERIGSKYSLLNLELRFPLIRYLITGGLPLFFKDIQGVIFLDAGAAWNETGKLRFFEHDRNNNFVSKDLLTGTGFGARLFFLYFLLRIDVAWAYNFDHFSSPKYYFSLGADF